MERIILGETEWASFQEALARPPNPNEALRKLLRETPPWKALLGVSRPSGPKP